MSEKVTNSIQDQAPIDPHIQIDKELTLAGKVSGLSPVLLDLEKNRITSTTELPPMEFLFSLFDEPCFPLLYRPGQIG